MLLCNFSNFKPLHCLVSSTLSADSALQCDIKVVWQKLCTAETPCTCKALCHCATNTQMHSAKKQKVTSFYSKSLPRPTVLLDKDDNPVRDRVDAPQPVTGALLGMQMS